MLYKALNCKNDNYEDQKLIQQKENHDDSNIKTVDNSYNKDDLEELKAIQRKLNPYDENIKVADNVILNNYSNIDTNLLLNIINIDNTITPQENQNHILKDLSKTGLSVNISIDQDNNTVINVYQEDSFHVSNFENPFICDKSVSDKIIGCPTFIKLKNNLFAGYLLKDYLPNLINEYNEKYNEKLIVKENIMLGQRYIELISIPYSIVDIGYYDIAGNISSEELDNINTILYKANIFTGMLEIFGMNNNHLPDKNMQARATELINRYLKQQGYSGSVIGMNIYNLNKHKKPSVIIKFIINSGQKLDIGDINVIGLDKKIDNSIKQKLYNISKYKQITKSVVNNVAKEYKMICSEFVVENIEEYNKSNLHIFLKLQSNQAPIKYLYMNYFNISNLDLYKLAANCNVIAGKYCAQKSTQTLAEILYKLSGSQPNLQYTDNNGLILSIYAGHKLGMWEWSTDNMAQILDYSFDNGLSFYAGSFNFYTPKQKLYALVIKPGINLKSLSLKTLNISPGISFYSILKHKYIIDVSLNMPINIIDIVQYLLLNNKSVILNKEAEKNADKLKEVQPDKKSFSDALDPSISLSFSPLTKDLKFNIHTKLKHNIDKNINHYNNIGKDKESSTNVENNKYFYTSLSLNYEKTLVDKYDINSMISFRTSCKLTPNSYIGNTVDIHWYNNVDKYPVMFLANVHLFGSIGNNSDIYGILNDTIQCVGYKDDKQYFFSKYAIGGQFFTFKEIMNTQKYIGQNMASLIYGFFINGYIMSNVDLNHNITIGYIGSIGVMIAIDIQGQLLYIAYYIGINGKYGFTIGSLNRVHNLGIKNMQRSMELLA